ncbi:hypothetical protein ACROYT_G003811 [Oculina patagonica]
MEKNCHFKTWKSVTNGASRKLDNSFAEGLGFVVNEENRIYNVSANTTGPYSLDVQRIVPVHPFAAASLQIMLRKKEFTPICLRAEVYGCEIPRGCIMRGSIGFIKDNAGYRKGFVSGFFWGFFLEVFMSGKRDSILKNKEDVILDEKPHARDLTRGTLVLGEDVNSPGIIRKGKIEQIGDTTCTIKTNDKTWNSKLKDVRIVKISNLC